MNRKDKQIDVSEKELKRIVRRSMELWALVIGVLGVLAFFTVVLEFYMAPIPAGLDEYTTNVLLVAFSMLIILFIVYAASNERSLRQEIMYSVGVRLSYRKHWEEEKERRKKLEQLYRELNDRQNKIVEWIKRIMRKVEEKGGEEPISIEVKIEELKELKEFASKPFETKKKEGA